VELDPSMPVEPVGVSPSRGDGSARHGAYDVDFLFRGPNSDLDATYVEWLRPRLKPMWKIAYLRCRDIHLTDDLVQNVAEKLFKMWQDSEARDRIKNGDAVGHLQLRRLYLMQVLILILAITVLTVLS
jgi:hypothetical protein